MKIYNSLTRKKEVFLPIATGEVGMYVCGPTVYDCPHIGHARSAYIFDVIRRYFKYKGFKTTFVRNVTDVDDKIIEKAKAVLSSQLPVASLKERVREVSKKYLDAYHEDMALLGIGQPVREPKATEYIPKMIKFITVLIDRGYAYEADGDVYFDIKKAKDYGRLSNQSVSNMEAGARIAPGEKKLGPLDFALWKKAKEEEPSWDSPWGKGRPGWHIECSVMSSDILGDEFDIHGGGIDLIFPHHENELAQSKGAGKKFARFWMHNGLLTINDEKMAKSSGNFITIKDFVEKYKDPDYLKLLFLTAHYRHPVDYSEEKLEEMKRMKERGKEFFRRAEELNLSCLSNAKFEKRNIGEVEKNVDKFIDAMDDDFNMPVALSAIFDLIALGNLFLAKTDIGSALTVKSAIIEICAIFVISFEEPELALEKECKSLIKARSEARIKKDFKKADEIRRMLLEKGIMLEDTKEGTVWRKRI